MKQRCWMLRLAGAAIGSATLVAVCLIGAKLPAALGYCLNLTPSERVGIYRRVAGRAERGTARRAAALLAVAAALIVIAAAPASAHTASGPRPTNYLSTLGSISSTRGSGCMTMA